MPIYKNTSVSGIVRGVKAFLGQESGLTRNDEIWNKSSEQKHNRTRKKLEETQQRLARVRQKLANKNDKLAELQELVAELEAASSQQQVSRKDTSIFFVVGRPKSGTSWVRLGLDRHPEILCKGEGEFFGSEYGSGQPQLGRPLDDIRPPSYRSLYTALARSDLLRSWIENSVWRHGCDTEEHIANLTHEAIYYFLTQRLAQSKLSQSKKRIVGDKTPFASPEIIKEISTICPEAKVIHIIRDGRDVAVSQLHHMWNHATTEEGEEGGWYLMASEELVKSDRYLKDPQEFLSSGESIFTEERLREAAEGWRSDVGAAHRDGPVLLGENYTEVRYEIMLEKPEEEFEQLFRFLGAQADEDVVARCVRAARFEKRSGGRERGQEDPQAFARKGIAGDWKNVFTEQDKAIFKEAAGDLLIELGYEENQDW